MTSLLEASEAKIEALTESVSARVLQLLQPELSAVRDQIASGIAAIAAHVDRDLAGFRRDMREIEGDVAGIAVAQRDHGTSLAALRDILQATDVRLQAVIKRAEERAFERAAAADAALAKTIDATIATAMKPRDEELAAMRSTSSENRDKILELTAKFEDVADPEPVTGVRPMPTLPTIETQLAATVIERERLRLEQEKREQERRLAEEQREHERKRQDSIRAHARWADVWAIARKAMGVVAIALAGAAAATGAAKIQSCAPAPQATPR